MDHFGITDAIVVATRKARHFIDSLLAMVGFLVAVVSSLLVVVIFTMLFCCHS